MLEEQGGAFTGAVKKVTPSKETVKKTAKKIGSGIKSGAKSAGRYVQKAAESYEPVHPFQSVFYYEAPQTAVQRVEASKIKKKAAGIAKKYGVSLEDAIAYVKAHPQEKQERRQ